MLYEILRQSANSDGIPILNKHDFKHYTQVYGKEAFRETLVDFITKEKPPYPYKKFSRNKIIKLFLQLQKQDTSKNVILDNNDNVMDKFDYKYSYEKYGLGYIQTGHAYNDISDYFHNRLRLNCPYMNTGSPVDAWEQGKLKSTFGALWRGVNSSEDLSIASYTEALRLGGSYVATQFKPNVATTVYDMTNSKRVVDTSMGWGDRLAGFYASSAEVYIGCDPNPNTFKKYQEQKEFYDKLTGHTKKVYMYNCGAEDLPWDEIEDIDLVFTSPPYFSTEKYNKGGENEEAQSWKKYPEYDSWMDNFLLPVSEKSLNSLNDDGFFMLNIMDPKIKGKRYNVCDTLVDTFKDKFLGQVGMRISQRPQGEKFFSEGESLEDYMSKVYIENIWCFGKGDVFRGIRTPDLTKFFE